MKKKILALIASATALFALASCGSSSAGTSYNGAYWFKSNDEKLAAKTERIEYKVYFSKGDGTLWNNSKLNSSSLSFSVKDDSSYVTELTYNADGTYLYKTYLKIFGAYTLADNSVREVADETVTETTFSGDAVFTPIKSVKTVRNTVPSAIGGTYDFYTTAYTSTVTYDGTAATTKIELNEGDESPEQFIERAKKETVIKKYNKNAYIDNSLMLLMFRNFKYTAGMSYSFASIEPLSGESNSITGSIYTTSTSSKTSATDNQYLVTCPISDVKFGSVPNRSKFTFNVVRMDFSTSGTTGQNFMRAYFAESCQDYSETNFTRHLPVMISQPMIFNTGYLVYELTTASLI